MYVANIIILKKHSYDIDLNNIVITSHLVTNDTFEYK